MTRNVELRCGHRKHIKIRSKDWSPVCWECRMKVSPIRRYPLREQNQGEWLEQQEETNR